MTWLTTCNVIHSGREMPQDGLACGRIALSSDRGVSFLRCIRYLCNLLRLSASPHKLNHTQ